MTAGRGAGNRADDRNADAARGILIRGGRVADVRAARFTDADVAISGDVIAETGAGLVGDAGEVIDAAGRYVLPGFIDPHLHIESSMITPLWFAYEALRHGTCTVFVDPHEIANVAGTAGVGLFLDMAREMPLNLLTAAPSCVPATDMEDAGGRIGLEDVQALLEHPGIYGLGEMMNFPGVIHGFGDARAKVDAALAAGKPVDGHCPGVRGDDLEAYVTNGRRDGVVRILTDHECTSAGEVIEKHEVGMIPALRYGSASPDLERILPELCRRFGGVPEWLMFCSDDLDCRDLVRRGHVDRILHRAAAIIREETGGSVEEAFLAALRCVTLTPADCYARYFSTVRRPVPGAIGPGHRADAVIASSLDPLEIEYVIAGGRIVFRNGEPVWSPPDFDCSAFRASVRPASAPSPDLFRVPAPEGAEAAVRVRIVGARPGSLLTEHVIETLGVRDGEILPDPERDIAYLAVVERHRGAGPDTVGFVRGLGLRAGAVASTVAHDSHNLIVAGADRKAMARAAELVRKAGGGMACVGDGVEQVLPLPVGGLMADQSARDTARAKEVLLQASRRIISRPAGGDSDTNVFMTLSFLALPVIPHLKITNRGLVDVDAFRMVPLCVE